MVDLIKTENGKIFDLASLPVDLQRQIYQHAQYDILKDQAKKEIKVEQIDFPAYVETWLQDKTERTREAYRIAVSGFLSWVEGRSIAKHPLLIERTHAKQYIQHLSSELKPNSIRAKIAALSSLYSELQDDSKIPVNPFRNLKKQLPKKEYKKAVKTDQNKTIPVMSRKEYKSILAEIRKQMKRPGEHQSMKNSRRAAARLLPAVQVMAEYGLRVGALQTVERDDQEFTFKTKGDKSFRREMESYFPEGKHPFEGYHVSALQMTLKSITKRLHAAGKIRHAYSAHDFRHFFAVEFYQKTGDLVRLKSLLGHASLNITDIYLQSIGATNP